jgi:glycosyltransferase involved in cell wall biosynthesis
VRILHTIESTVLGGAEKLMLALALGLARRGYEPVFAVPPEGWLAEEVTRRKLPLVPLPPRRSIDIGFVRWLVGLVRKENISVIHAHMMAMNLYGSIASRLAHVPCVPTLHGRLYDLERARRRLLYRGMARLAGNLVAVSDELGQALISEAGISPSRVMVIPNGIDLVQFRPAYSETAAAKLPVLICVSTLLEVKGHRYLLEAMPQIRRQFPAVKLLIVGDGPLHAELEQQQCTLQLADAVSFLGERADVPELLAESSIFVMPSLSEGQSLSLMEAMAAALPVVTTRVGGNREIVAENETGLLVPPGNPEALAAAICSLLCDPQRARQLGLSGRARIAAKFSLEAVLDRYEALYQQLLAGRPV